jgi:transcriptional regulator with XRE-family HTH domain
MSAKQFAAALKRLKLSPTEVGRRLGVQRSTISRWLTSERKIPGPVQAAIRCWERQDGVTR